MKSTFFASLGNITQTRWCTNANLISANLDEESPLSKSKSTSFVSHISMPDYFVGSSTFTRPNVFLW
jgi:predicted DNA-binding ribbon-helix-helix protein